MTCRRRRQRSHTADDDAVLNTVVNGARRGPQETHARSTPPRFRVVLLAGIQKKKIDEQDVWRTAATARPAAACVVVPTTVFSLSPARARAPRPADRTAPAADDGHHCCNTAARVN